MEREVGDVRGLVEVEPAPVASTSKVEGEGEEQGENVVEVREKKKKGKKGRGKKEETDQEFLMKCVCLFSVRFPPSYLSPTLPLPPYWFTLSDYLYFYFYRTFTNLHFHLP